MKLSMQYRKRRKGYVLASCFISLLLVVSLSTCILLSIDLQQSSLKLEKIRIDNRFKISQIGEKFLNDQIHNNDVIDGYTCTVENKQRTEYKPGNIWHLDSYEVYRNYLTVKNKSGDIVLYVVEEKGNSENGGKDKILKWNTSDFDKVMTVW